MASHAVTPDAFNIVHPEHYAAHGYPHEVWTRLRAEEPVSWYEHDEGGIPFWAITKHADIVTIGKRPDVFESSTRLTISHMPEEARDLFPPTLIQLDPPKHGLYRQMVSKRFTPRYLQRMHADIEQIGKETCSTKSHSPSSLCSIRASTISLPICSMSACMRWR